MNNFKIYQINKDRREKFNAKNNFFKLHILFLAFHFKLYYSPFKTLKKRTVNKRKITLFLFINYYNTISKEDVYY